MLTDQAIRAMKPPEKGYRIEWDGKLKGFGCRISQAGTRAFVVLIASGRPKTIGRYGPGGMTLAEARKQAQVWLAQKTLGKVHPTRTPFSDAARQARYSCGGRRRKTPLDRDRPCDDNRYTQKPQAPFIGGYSLHVCCSVVCIVTPCNLSAKHVVYISKREKHIRHSPRTHHERRKQPYYLHTP